MDQLLGHVFKDRRLHPTRREVVARVVLSCVSIATAFLATCIPATFTYAMVAAGGPLAPWGVVLIGAIGAVLLIDTIANEMAPRKRLIPPLTGFRQLLWMTLGLLHMLFAFIVFTANLSTSLGTYLVIFAWGCFLLAFVDAAQQKTDEQCDPR
jgi:hypothetical protein